MKMINELLVVIEVEGIDLAELNMTEIRNAISNITNVVIVEAKAEFVKEAAAQCIDERELSSNPGLNIE